MRALTATPAGAAPVTFGFLTHAAFFSVEAKLPDLVDPHVFVADANAVAATGPQRTTHWSLMLKGRA